MMGSFKLNVYPFIQINHLDLPYCMIIILLLLLLLIIGYLNILFRSR